MSWWTKIRDTVEKIAPAAVGYMVGGPIGGMAGAAIGGALMGDKAQQKGADQQQSYLSDALKRSDPFYENRAQYGTQLNDLMKNPNAVMDTPYTKFQQQQGQQAIERSGAARGLLQSPQMALELQKYGQGLASESFQQQFQNLAMLSGANVNPAQAAGVLSQKGQVAANTAQTSGQAQSSILGSMTSLLGGNLLSGLFGGTGGFDSPDVFQPGEQQGIFSTIDPGGILAGGGDTLGGFDMMSSGGF